jgi:uncharacterized protein (TIGR02145 family)
MKLIILFSVSSFLFYFPLSSQNDSIANHFTDSRDGRVYKLIKIGNQTWMAENLSFQINDGSWPFDLIEENREKFGLLYSWDAAQKACPIGWGLPTKDNWQALIDFVGLEKISEGALVDIKEGGTNSTGFAAVHGGCIDGEGFFYDSFASFWTRSESKKGVWYVNLVTDTISLNQKDCKEWAGFSIRCINIYK